MTDRGSSWRQRSPWRSSSVCWCPRCWAARRTVEPSGCRTPTPAWLRNPSGAARPVSVVDVGDDAEASGSANGTQSSGGGDSGEASGTLGSSASGAAAGGGPAERARVRLCAGGAGCTVDSRAGTRDSTRRRSPAPAGECSDSSSGAPVQRLRQAPRRRRPLCQLRPRSPFGGTTAAAQPRNHRRRQPRNHRRRQPRNHRRHQPRNHRRHQPRTRRRAGFCQSASTVPTFGR